LLKIRIQYYHFKKYNLVVIATENNFETDVKDQFDLIR